MPKWGAQEAAPLPAKQRLAFHTPKDAFLVPLPAFEGKNCQLMRSCRCRGFLRSEAYLKEINRLCVEALT